MRCEALTIEPDTDPPQLTVWFRPDEEIAQKIDDANCRLEVEVEYHWVEADTAESNQEPRGRHKVRRVEGEFKKTLPMTSSANRCFLEAVIIWRLVCDTHPPLVRELFRGVYHIRTSTDCTAQRGKLPE